MPVRVDLKLKASAELNIQMSSLFQGVIMEALQGQSELIEKLHSSELHPYTQHLELIDGHWHWILTFTDDELFSSIWANALAKTQSFSLSHNSIEISVEESLIKQISYQNINAMIVEQEPHKKIKLNFLTPTAFKSNGRYVFFPELPLIFNSIMNKYDSAVNNTSVSDEDTLEQLCMNSFICDYKLRSTRFSLEGTRIPSFVGNIVIMVKANNTMAAFINMLLKFSEFSGIGIKTALGMGAVSVEFR